MLNFVRTLYLDMAISEEVLLKGLLAHDEKAYSLLYDRYAPTLLGIISKIVRDEVEAENILQDTFVKVWKNIHQFDPAKGRLFTWLLNIARNTAFNFMRSTYFSASRQIQNLESVVYTETVGVEHDELNHIGMSDVVQQLEPKLRQVIEMIYFLGFTQQEAAEKLNLPLGTVKSRTRTALQQLRHQLSD